MFEAVRCPETEDLFDAPRFRPEGRLFLGLTGGKGAGKDTAATVLINEYDCQRLPFAGALKAMLRALLAYQGVSSALIERMIEGDQKEAPSRFLGGRSPRYCMQTLGTEWGRDMVAIDLWLSVWGNAVSVHEGPVVVTDVRFPNEVEEIRKRGGVMIGVTRVGLEANDNHASETQLGAEHVDLMIENRARSRDEFIDHVSRTLSAVLDV